MLNLHKFNGPVYSPVSDNKRLTRQHERIFDVMSDERWRTHSEIAEITKDPQNSVSAQLRHMRKPRFGSHKVDRRRRGGDASSLWEYSLKVNYGPVPVLEEKIHGGTWARVGDQLTVTMHKNNVSDCLTKKQQRWIANRVMVALKEAEIAIQNHLAVTTAEFYNMENK